MKHVVVISSIAVAVFLTTLSAMYARPLLESLNIWPQPDPITELYFTEPAKLPAAFTAGEELALDVSLRNLENSPTQYDLSIEQVDSQSNSKTPLTTSSFSLDHSQQTRRTIPIKPADIPGASQFIVTVRYRHDGADSPAKQLIISHWIKNIKEV